MGKLNALIVAHPDDSGFIPIRWALEQAGVSVYVWNWRDFPARSVGTIRVGSSALVQAQVSLPDYPQTDELSSVWYRRPGAVVAGSGAHPADRLYIQRESLHFVRGALSALQPSRWVNHPEPARTAENKVMQLQMAGRIGLRIPDTVITNDPGELRAFYEKHGKRIVHKSFAPMVWDSESGSSISETAVVPPDLMQNDAAIRLCPGIYQEQIDKSYELRVTVFGKVLSAVALWSQEIGTTVDWRTEQALGRVRCERIELDSDIAAKCFAICECLNLQYAAIDIAVKPNGEQVFFELNQSGNFLAFDLNAGTNGLQKICSLLSNYELSPEDFPSLSEFIASEELAVLIAAGDMPQRISPERAGHFSVE